MKDRISRILAPLGMYIHAVFFTVDDGEETKRVTPEDTYTLDIYLLYNTGDDPHKAAEAVAEACSKINHAFRSKLLTEGRWRLIELRDCVAMSDEAMTFRQSLRLKKWNVDYLSLRDISQTQPVE
jgi:hypothetical protein